MNFRRSKTAIEVSRGSFTKAEQDDENFTLIAEFPGDDPAPPAGTNTPWMAVAEAELAAGVREMRSNPRIEEYFQPPPTDGTPTLNRGVPLL